MSTVLAAGSTATISVGVTDMIEIDCASGGTARVEAVSGVAGSTYRKILVEHRGGRGRYGPFGSGSIKLGAIGAQLRYDYGTSPRVEDPRPLAGVVSANAPSDSDGMPDDTIWIKTA